MQTDLSYHAAIDGKQDGPFDFDALEVLIKKGKFNKETLVWKPGMAEWIPAGQVAELAPVFAPPPPPGAATVKTEPVAAVKAEPASQKAQPAAIPPSMQTASQAQKPKSAAKTVAKVLWSIIGIIAIIFIFYLLDELFFGLFF